MFNIYFGYDKKAVLDVDSFFNHCYRPEWFEDDLVKRIVKDVDKSDVLSQHCIQSPVLGQISPRTLSGGTKTLILLLKRDNFYPDLVNCGNNCCKWLVEIGKVRDFKAALSGVDLLFDDCEVEAFCLNDSTIVRGMMPWFDKMVELVSQNSEWE